MPRAQVVHYKCCNGIFAACVEPYYEEDHDWIVDFNYYTAAGHKTGIVDEFKFGHVEGCRLYVATQVSAPLFEDKNQMKLF